MAAVTTLNPKAELVRASQALAVNISAAKGIQDVLKTNLGPKGTMKMLVSGSGDIKITKDGNVLLHEMQIQHPTASLIARASTAQDDILGDGTTSSVLFTGELLKQADHFLMEGVHPRILAEGFSLAKNEALKVLETMKITMEMNRKTLFDIAHTSLSTKVSTNMAKLLTEMCVDGILAIQRNNVPLDLHMIEIAEMQHRSEFSSQLVLGLVMDHGGRHPDMPRRLENVFILTCNISLEYEKTEVTSGFFYKSAQEREKLLQSEHAFIQQRVKKIIDLKRKVCAKERTNFLVVNQKGIDPDSLDMLAKEGILALRRAKRRNMERLPLACGGYAINSVDELTPDCLGFAGLVYEHILGEDKYTFVEQCKDPHSVTILLKAASRHNLTQLKDAVRDGLRAVKNALDDSCVLPGAGAVELAISASLKKFENTVTGRMQLAVRAFSEAVLIIPKILGGNNINLALMNFYLLAQNSGFDPLETLVNLQEEARKSGMAVGIDIDSGNAILPEQFGIFDNYSVKKHIISNGTIVATNLLLVDEIMRAGLSSLKQQ